jgi:hypothetical protein
MSVRYLTRPIPQSDIEEECLWSIVTAYVTWCYHTRHRIQALSYWRALGLTP